MGLRGSKSGDVGAQAVEEVQDDAKVSPTLPLLLLLQPSLAPSKILYVYIQIRDKNTEGTLVTFISMHVI